MDLDPIILSIPIFFILIGIELIYDARQKKKSGESLYRLNDSFANISCGIIDQVSGVFTKVVNVGIYTVVFHFFSSKINFAIPSNWFWYILAFVLIDLAYYWAHRLSHQVNILWVGHEIHHQSEEYNLSVALRQGAFQKLLTFWVYLPLAIVGFPPVWFVMCISLNLLYQFWIHTEMIDKMGWFEAIFNTPSHHRVHHGRNPKYIDKNHGGVFIIWDKIFGTFQVEEEHPTYGITRPINTFNPVYAHFLPFKRLWQDVKLMPSFADKVKFLFNAPGWQPTSLGGIKYAPPIDEQPEKFQLTLLPAINYYLLAQYVLCIIATAIFLFGLDNYSQVQKVFYLLFILYSVLSLGLVFDLRKYSWFSENLRILVTMVFSWLIITEGELTVISIALLSLNFASWAWLLSLKKKFKQI